MSGRAAVIGRSPKFQYRLVAPEAQRRSPAPAAVLTDNPLPVPPALSRALDGFLRVCSPALVGWHPNGHDVLVNYKGSNDRPQLHLISSSSNAMTALTNEGCGVYYGVFQPTAAPEFLAYEVDNFGDEKRKIVLKNLHTGETRRVEGMRDDWRYDIGPWRPDGERMLVTAIPMGRYDGPPVTELYELDPHTAALRKLTELPSFRWHAWAYRDSPGLQPLAWSADGRTILACEESASDTRGKVASIDAATGDTSILFCDTPEDPVFYHAAKFIGSGLFLLTDRDSEFHRLARCRDDHLEYLTPDQWDVSDFQGSPDGSVIAAVINEGGNGVLHLYETETGQPLTFPRDRLPAGSVTTARWSPDGARLALYVQSAHDPGGIQLLDWRTGNVHAATPRLELGLGDLPPPQIFAVRSEEGHDIPCWVHWPAGHADGPVPVVIDIHGGPEGQAENEYEPECVAWLKNGYAVVRPNVRGSTGYGKTYRSASVGVHRMRATADIVTVLEWTRRQPGFTDFIVLRGASYGAYETYSGAAASPHVSVAIADCGATNLVSMLERVPPSRKDYRRAVYGDERDPTIRRVLEAVAPRNRVEHIRCPVLISQGMNDPRIPAAEAEDMVEALRREGVPVTFLRFADEGHIICGHENLRYLLAQSILFANRLRAARDI